MVEYQHTETDLPAENEYPKAIRDDIPATIFANEGVEADVRVVPRDEFIQYLIRKASEEADELADARTREHQLEEVADLRETLNALVYEMGVSEEEVLAIMDAKRQQRGGFRKRLVLLSKPGSSRTSS